MFPPMSRPLTRPGTIVFSFFPSGPVLANKIDEARSTGSMRDAATSRLVSRLEGARGIGAVIGDYTGLAQNGVVHRRHIAVPDERFRVCPDGGIVEQRQNPA